MTDGNEWIINADRRRGVRDDVEAQARAAYANNIAFLAQPAPAIPLNAAAQLALVAQVAALTRQVQGLIRLAVTDLLEP